MSTQYQYGLIIKSFNLLTSAENPVEHLLQLVHTDRLVLLTHHFHLLLCEYNMHIMLQVKTSKFHVHIFLQVENNILFVESYSIQY